MRCAWLFALITGCAFTASPPSISGTADGGSDPGSGGTGSGSGSGSGTGTTTNPPCDVTGDPSLRLCVGFDRVPMVEDLSDYAHMVTEAVDLAPLTRDGLAAVSLSATSHIQIAEAKDLDVDQLTIDMWIQPAAIATGQRYWMLDNNTQYFISYLDTKFVRCGIDTQTVDSAAAITDMSWHHVACTYDRQKLAVYVDGDRSRCMDLSAAIPKSGTLGVAIGANNGAGGYTDHYIGGLDNVHVYARALSTQQICSAAGKSSCNDQCGGGE